MAEWKLNVAVDDEKFQQFIKTIAAMPGMFDNVSGKVISMGNKVADSVEKSTTKQAAASAKAAAAVEAANEKRISKEQALNRALGVYAEESAESAKKYAALKANYENKSVDEIRTKIHAMNESVRQERVQTANTVKRLSEADDKEAAAAIKKESQLRINAQEKELQQFRLLEQEKVGRTFAEIQERVHAATTGNKEILSMLQASAAKEEELQKKITVTFETEEKKRLQAALSEAKQETAAIKQEAENRKIEPQKEKGGGGIGFGQVAMIGTAVAGLSTLIAKSSEVAATNKAMMISFGDGTEQAKKEAEEIGATMGKTGAETGKVMAELHAMSGLQGKDLEKYTQAYMAAQDAGIKISAKSLQTEAGRQKLMEMGGPLIANAMKTAQEPEVQAALAQKDMEETAGNLANTLLTGLAPVLHDLTPLIGTLGGLVSDLLGPAMKGLGFVLHPVIDTLTTLKPILPELAIAAGILTVAMNLQTISIWAQNAAWLANPLTWIIAGIVALVVVVVQLVKHWDEVTATLKKVWETITDAGGALLGFLGITGKAEAATIKHHKALRDEAAALEATRKAAEDAAKATADYTTALEANMEDVSKSAKQGQDDAVAAVADIQNKLKTATGKEKEVLELRLQQWTEYGQRQRSIVDQQDADTQAAKDKIYGKEKEDAKAAKDTTAKDEYAAIKERLAQKYDALKEAAENERGAEQNLHARELELQKQQDEELLAETEAYNLKHQTKKKETASLERKIQHDGHVIDLDEQVEQIKELATQRDEDLNALEVEGAKKGFTEKEIAAKSYEIKRQALEDELKLEEFYGKDTEATKKALADLERVREVEEAKQTLAITKELQASADATKLEGMKSQLEKMKALQSDGANNALAIAAQENKIVAAEEDARYAKELVDRKGDLANEAMGAKLAESLAANHEGKKTAIAQAGADERKRINLQEVQTFMGPVVQGMNKGFSMMFEGINAMTKKWTESKNVAVSVFGTIAAGFVQMIEQMIEKVAAMEAVLLVANLIPGFGAFMESISAIGSLVPGHAEGTDSSPGGWHVVGEKGMEFINMHPGAQVIPNHALSSSRTLSYGSGVGGGMDLGPVVKQLSLIHAATSNPRTILPMNNDFENPRNRNLYSEQLRER